MAKINFVNDKFKPIDVATGAILMQSLLVAGIPVSSSCKGDGVCAKCRIKIISGNDHLSSPNPTEKFLKEKNNISGEFRISCQTQVFGDIVIDTSYW